MSKGEGENKGEGETKGEGREQRLMMKVALASPMHTSEGVGARIRARYKCHNSIKR